MKKKVKLSRIVLVCMILILFLPVIKKGLDKIFVYDRESGKLSVYKSFFYDYEYEIDKDGNVCLEDYHGGEVEVIVPDTVLGKQVTEIGFACFEGNTTIEKVILPSGVKKISVGAFNCCTNLKEVLVNGEGNISSIDDAAFNSCINLEKFNCGNKIKFIGWRTFKNCSKLTTINEQSNLNIIGYKAFEDSGLLEISLDNIEKLASKVFTNTPYLENLRSGNEEFVIVNNILFDCNSREEVIIIPGNVRFVDCDFSDCPNVKMIIFTNVSNYNNAILPEGKSVKLVFPHATDIAGFNEGDDITVIWMEIYRSGIEDMLERYGIKAEFLTNSKMQELVEEHGLLWKK